MYSPIRSKLFTYFNFAVLSLLTFFLFKVQIIDGALYRKRSENNRIRLIPIKATRGRIFDRNKIVLADNQPSFNLYVIPQDFFLDSCEALAEILGMPAATIRNSIEHSSSPSFQPIILKRDLTRLETHKIEERKADFGGLLIDVEGKRYYPWNDVGAHILGYLGKISKEEYSIKKYIGYLIDDYVGRLGVEYLFDEVLRGDHGGKQIEVNARGKEMKVLAYKQPFQGAELTLTIDIVFQEKLYELLKDETASIAVMDVTSGELLALVSHPSFDPNAFVTPSRSDERLVLLRDKTLPFLNRPLSSRYPPGSVFKLVTALAALEDGIITPASTFNCNSVYQLAPNTRPFHCWSVLGHGKVDLYKGLQQSCNIYFYQVGRKLGADGIARFAKKIGLGDPVHIELPNVTRGLIPSTKWKRERLHEQWYQGETLHYAIGQGYVAVTPLQILRLVSIIANNGKIIEPTIIKGVRHKPRSFRIQKENIKAIKQGMLKAVNTEYGTGHVARVDFFRVAGKTGTAETSGEPHSWFAGFFPYKQPQIAMVIVVEHGGIGGGKAARLANKAATLWHNMYET